MNNLSEFKKAIQDSINKVNNIPQIKTENFDTQTLKSEVIPLLEEASKRLDDIESINDNIDGIRNEIIQPVSKIISSNSKKNNWLAILGVLMGLTGAALTFSSTYNDNKLIQLVQEQNEKTTLIIEEKNKILKNQAKEKVLIVSRSYNGNKMVELVKTELSKNEYRDIFNVKEVELHNNGKNSIPYIYYKDSEFDNSLIKAIDKYYKESNYRSREYGKIIGIMNIYDSQDREIIKLSQVYDKYSIIIAL